MKQLISLLFLMIFTAGCADLFYQRRFADEMDRQSDGFFEASRDFQVVSGDEGQGYRSREEILLRTPASTRNAKQDRLNNAIRQELVDLENALGEEEYQRYLSDSSTLVTDSQKIYYLKLSRSERTQYIKMTKFGGIDNDSRSRGSFEMARAPVKSRDEISLGMSKDKIIQSLGKPTRVEYAGQPSHENERWSFYTQSGVKRVYFDGGRVSGWELD